MLRSASCWAWAPRTEHSWAARSMQPHSKLGLVVATMLRLMLGFFFDDSSVDIVLGTGTSDKAPLVEAVIGAALVIADGAQLGCSVGAVRGITIARNKARFGRHVGGTMLGLKLGLFAGTSVGIVLAWAPRTEHSWAARLVQPHSKLGLVVSMIRGLTLGLSVDALVGIVLGTGTSDKEPLEETVVGAALGIADGAQLCCSVDAITLKARTRSGYDTRTETGTLCGCFGRCSTGHHNRSEESLPRMTRRGYDARTDTGTLRGCFGRYCAEHRGRTGAELVCSVDATALKDRTRSGYDTRTETGTLCGSFGRYCAGHWHLRQSTTGRNRRRSCAGNCRRSTTVLLSRSNHTQSWDS